VKPAHSQPTLENEEVGISWVVPISLTNTWARDPRDKTLLISGPIEGFLARERAIGQGRLSG